MTQSSLTNLNLDTAETYCVAVIYDSDAVEIEVLALSSSDAMDIAEITATSELPPGWKELVLICEPESKHKPTRKTRQ
jgi:hypothetical protein